MAVITFEMIVQALVILAGMLGLTMTGPMTDHAVEGHVDDAINASVMVETVTECLNGDPNEHCDRMDLYFCRKHHKKISPQARFVCHHYDTGQGDALIIGLRGKKPRVVTGYRASSRYWERGITRDQCVPISIDFLKGFMNYMYPGLVP